MAKFFKKTKEVTICRTVQTYIIFKVKYEQTSSWEWFQNNTDCLLKYSRYIYHVVVCCSCGLPQIGSLQINTCLTELAI